MPDTIFRPGSRPFLKDQLHLDAWPPHDGQRVFDEGLKVEMQGDLIRTIGGRDRRDSLDGEHARFFPKMTIADEIQAAGGIPEPVGIDLPPGHTPTCGRIVAHLDLLL